jgi:hypothetical protein
MPNDIDLTPGPTHKYTTRLKIPYKDESLTFFDRQMKRFTRCYKKIYGHNYVVIGVTQSKS